jgi:serine/threonine protein kinase HipA of HipAB toxin-antitoxin module
VGNGDLHAKNISILRAFSPGALGAPPTAGEIIYSPLYDLLNTNIVIRDDLFALPVNGRQNNLRARDLLVLVERWGLPKRLGSARIEQVAAETERHVGDVLDHCGLSDQDRERYADIVRGRIANL